MNEATDGGLMAQVALLRTLVTISVGEEAKGCASFGIIPSMAQVYFNQKLKKKASGVPAGQGQEATEVAFLLCNLRSKKPEVLEFRLGCDAEAAWDACLDLIEDASVDFSYAKKNN